uniref:Uncharacterized protein n=1 Tax=Rhizophora mucronata TaxID=61149 RepID=A0A2P2J543_RHIMU
MYGKLERGDFLIIFHQTKVSFYLMKRNPKSERIYTVKRHRKRSCVLKPDISTRPASSRDKKLRLSVVFFSDSCPLHPLTTSFLLLITLLGYKLAGFANPFWCSDDLGRNGV